MTCRLCVALQEEPLFNGQPLFSLSLKLRSRQFSPSCSALLSDLKSRNPPPWHRPSPCRRKARSFNSAFQFSLSIDISGTKLSSDTWILAFNLAWKYRLAYLPTPQKPIMKPTVQSTQYPILYLASTSVCPPVRLPPIVEHPPQLGAHRHTDSTQRSLFFL